MSDVDLTVTFDRIAARLGEERARRWLVDLLIAYLSSDHANFEEVAASGMAGEDLADEAIVAWFNDRVFKHQLIPGILAKYMSDREHRLRPAHRPASWETKRREIGIVAAVYIVAVNRGVELTRSVASSRPCAASIVAKQLTKRGIKISEKTVANLLPKWRWLAEAHARQRLLSP
jgi:hypothetical protein